MKMRKKFGAIGAFQKMCQECFSLSVCLSVYVCLYMSVGACPSHSLEVFRNYLSTDTEIDIDIDTHTHTHIHTEREREIGR